MKIASQYEIVLALCEVISAPIGVEHEVLDKLKYIACDAAGMPRDNTVETGCSDYANQHRVWPHWGFCRDFAYDAFEEFKSNPARMASFLLTWDKQDQPDAP